MNDAFARVFLRRGGARSGGSSVVGAPFAAIFADFAGLHPSLHAGMVERFLTVLKKKRTNSHQRPPPLLLAFKRFFASTPRLWMYVCVLSR